MSDIGENVPVQPMPCNDRALSLKNDFQTRFHQKADFLIRVPGRVNLIGEHIDYCGYGVCPMALEQDVLLAVGIQKESATLDLENVDAKFNSYHCEDIKTITIDIGNGAPQWYQYFLCGVKGICDILPKDQKVHGLKVLVTSTVPQSAGLSSSSALVSSAALATAQVNDYSISKTKLASLCAECERYIGTQGGGMDQAIAFLATEGCAKLIDFGPLRSQDVALPSGAVFVVAHSLSELNKAATSDYNCRVVECRLAAQIIAKSRGLNWRSIKKLGEVQIALNVAVSEMIKIVKQVLPKDQYSKEIILEILDVPLEELESISFTAANTKAMQTFMLKQRALHVYQEALRVQQFHETCTQSKASKEAILSHLGELMTASHNSLRDLYDCSHPQLDKLVNMSKELTLGCRLTGAGWGGCVVALVKPENVEKYLKMLKEKYYAGLGVTEGLENLAFATGPNGGACVYMNKE